MLGATKIGCILKPRERTRTETFQDRAREAKPASLLPPRVDACVQTEQRSDAPPVTSPVLDLGSSTPPRDQVQNAEGEQESEHSEAASEAERRREQEVEMQRQARHSFSLSAAPTAPATLQPGSYLEEQEGGGQEGVDGATKVERGGVARMAWAWHPSHSDLVTVVSPRLERRRSAAASSRLNRPGARLPGSAHTAGQPTTQEKKMKTEQVRQDVSALSLPRQQVKSACATGSATGSAHSQTKTASASPEPACGQVARRGSIVSMLQQVCILYRKTD